MSSPSKEKILVLGIDSPIGLTLLRELGRHGLEVHGVARSDRGVGLYSRWLAKAHILSGPRDQQLQGLLAILKAEAIPALMAVSEADLLWLDRHRAAFEGVRLLIPERAQLDLVLDKARVLAVAEQVGVPVPRTLQPERVEAVQGVGLRFPVVLKWADPNEVAPALGRAGIGLEKFQYAYDEADLLSKLRRYDPVGVYPLVQEFCPGHGLGQMFLMHQGQAALYFQHHRVHEWPPEGGFSALCEAVPPTQHQALREQSLALLQALQWEGVAMVEYRHDPETGRSALMEINGRFWGSQPLASHAGAEFAWELYRLRQRAEAPQPERAYRTGFRCMYLIPDLKRLAVILLAPGKIQNKALHFSRLGAVFELLATWCNPRTRYFVFQWSDPKPFFADLFLAARDIVLRRG